MSNKQSWRRILGFLYFTQGITVNDKTIPGWLATHPEESKLNHSLKRVAERALKLNEEMGRRIEDLEIDHQATNADKVLLYNPDGTPAYTAQGKKALRDAKLALNDEEFEIEPHYCSDLPELPEGTREILTGFVIKEESTLREVKTG